MTPSIPIPGTGCPQSDEQAVPAHRDGPLISRATQGRIATGAFPR